MPDDDPGNRWGTGLRLAVTTLSVLPVRAGRVDRRTAAVAMAVAPLVGLLIGAVVAGVSAGTAWLGLPVLVTAVLAVTTGLLGTRALHLDGLADTVDAFGSYRPAAGALDVMKKPDIGPFGVAAIVLTLLLQVAALAAAGPVAALTAWTAGRLAVPIACRKGVPAARPDGLGALVAGTVPYPALAVAVMLTGVAAVPAVPGRPWLGPVAVAVAVAVAAATVARARKRFGGITGDVIGASVELATTAALLVLSAR